MPKKLLDVVYVLKSDIDTEELRYSLRSVEKNFPCRKVWFAGGQPNGFEPDGRISHKQYGATKWDMIKSSLSKVLETEEITEDFFWFNDDFFVMKPFKGKFVNYADGTLTARIEELREENPWLNHYGRTVFKAREELKTLGYGEVNFEVHLPILFNKELLRKSLNVCSSPQIRSIYGNYNRIPFVQKRDVKVYDLESAPEDADFLSTSDKTFVNGKVGELIRGEFSNPSRWETPTPKGV